MSGTMLAVGIAGAVVTGAIAANASQSAANTQADAARNASQNTLTATQQTNAMQQGMFNQTQQNESPFLQSGQVANAALMAGLGLGNPYATPQYSSGVLPGGPNMTTQPVTGGGPTMQALGVGAPAASAGAMNPVGSFSTNAQGQQVDANGVAINPNALPNYGATNAQMGAAAQSQIDPTTGQGNFTKTFTPSSLTLDPSYQFVLEQGMKGINNAQAARGQTGSSQGMQDIAGYTTGLASTQYQQAYQNFMNTQNTQVARLQSLAGQGQNTSVQQGAQGVQTASNMAGVTMGGVNASNQYMTGAAAANAAGQVGVANAFTGAMGNATNNWMNMQIANKFAPQPAAPAAGNNGYVPGVTGQTPYTPPDYSLG